MTKQCQSIGKVGRIRNLVKLILSRRVLKEETVGQEQLEGVEHSRQGQSDN